MFPRQIVGAAFSIGALYANLVNAAPAGHQHGVAPVSSRQSFPVCTDGSIIKNMWLVDQLNVAYTSDELVRPGNASFAITNNLTNTTETIRCSLRANYVCEVHGTPGYDSLQIWLQINLDVARFTLNQSLVCSNAPDSGYVFLPNPWNYSNTLGGLG